MIKFIKLDKKSLPVCIAFCTISDAQEATLEITSDKKVIIFPGISEIDVTKLLKASGIVTVKKFTIPSITWPVVSFMPFHRLIQNSLKLSLVFQRYTKAATSAPIATTTNVIGPPITPRAALNPESPLPASVKASAILAITPVPDDAA